jgi:3-oxoadipate enol-lactonase
MLLHGLGATAALNWFTAIPALEREFRVVAPDHRGHGRGIRAAAPFTLGDLADDVVALADALQIDRFVAVGYSMGGPIAQLIWRRHRARVSGLVLCATAYRFRVTPREHVMFAALPSLRHANRIVPDVVSRQLIARVSRPYLAETGYGAWAERELLLRDPAAVLHAAGELGRFAVHDWIGEIDVPTSVLVHSHDQLVPPSRQLDLASAIPGAVARVVDADHFAAVRTPERFAAALLDAVHDVTSARATPSVMRRAS